jgi:ABC-type sugar transport system substrate-binding protein
VAVVSALKYMKLQPVHIGFDYNAFIEKAISEKRLYGTVVQQPDAMGFSSVEAIHRYLTDKKLPQSVFLDVKFVTAK